MYNKSRQKWTFPPHLNNVVSRIPGVSDFKTYIQGNVFTDDEESFSVSLNIFPTSDVLTGEKEIYLF